MTAMAKTAQRGSGFGTKMFLAVAIGICFVWSQVCGWAVTGRMLADDGARRTVQATSSSTAAEDLKRLQDERDLIGTPRPKGTVEAELDLELRKTSRQYPDGNGPAATKLRGELAAIERAIALDTTLIPAALKALERRPAVAAGDVDVAIPVGMAQRLGWIDADDETAKAAAQDARFWFIVFLVFAVAFFATFGFKFVGVTHTEIFERGVWLLKDKPIACVPLVFLIVEAGMNATYGWQRAGAGFFNPEAWLQAAMFAGAAVIGAYLPTRWDSPGAPARSRQGFDPYDWGPKQLALHPRTQEALGGEAPRYSASAHEQAPADWDDPLGTKGRQRDDGWDARSLPERSVASSSMAPQHAAPASARPEQHQHGAPITINVGGDGPRGSVPLLPAPASAVRSTSARAGTRTSSRRGTHAPPAERAAAFAPEAPQKPVDRRHANELIDHFLTFRAACVLDDIGGGVTADAMWDRYLAWAGRRARSRPIFEGMLPELTGIVTTTYAGELHYCDVALREGVELRLADAG